MPNWKKVITSGSNAHLNQITASNISIGTLQNVSNINPGTGTTGDIDISSAKIEIKASNNSTAGLELFGGTVGSVAPFIDVDSPHTAFVLKVAGTDRMLVNSTGITINDDNGNFDFQIDGNTNDNVFFLDAGTEKIGIGTNSPGSKLEVDGDITATHITASGNISASGTITSNVIVNEAGGTINDSGGASSFRVKGATDDNLIFTNASGNDNIGIGQVPVAGDGKLQITGDVNISSHITASGNISASQSVITNALTASSFQFVGSGTAELEVQGNITASGIISASGNLISSRQFDKSGTSNNHLAQGDIIYQGGGSTTQGNIVYMKTDGEWGDAQADAASTATSLLGIALGTDPDVDGVLLRGTYTLDHDVGNNQGVPLYLSDTTAGQATVTAPSDDGDIIRIIGYNLGDDDEIWFDPDKSWVEHN